MQGKVLNVASIYGANSYSAKRVLWPDLNNLQGPWCVLGYFNVIFFVAVARGGSLPNNLSCAKFHDWINSNELLVIPSSGASFTWSNGRLGNQRIERKLDRVLCNFPCLDTWYNCRYKVLVRNYSNHHPLLVEFASSLISRKPYTFKFFKMWLQHRSCRQFIQQSWDENVVGCPMFILQQKLKRLKLSLKDWNKNVFGNVHEVVVDKQKILLSLQHQIQVADSAEMDMLLVQQQQAMQNLDMTLDCQALFWKEKYKMLWFKDGDRNSSFFHAMVKKRANSNGIQRLVDGDSVFEDHKDIEEHILFL